MRYIEIEGANRLFQIQTSLFEEFGERFKPNAGWSELLRHEEKPYSPVSTSNHESGVSTQTPL